MYIFIIIFFVCRKRQKQKKDFNAYFLIPYLKRLQESAPFLLVVTLVSGILCLDNLYSDKINNFTIA
jgi:hypothetical protein